MDVKTRPSGDPADSPPLVRPLSTGSVFCQTLQSALHERCGVAHGDRLIVAVSGGADSIALLLGLWSLAQRSYRDYHLIVGYVQHGLRPEARNEERAVKRLAVRLGLEFERADITHELVSRSGGMSAAARKERYLALGRMAQRHSARVVTGHHGDDQFETVLMSLIRGAGLQGLAGLAWREEVFGVWVLRPMLALNHADCEEACRLCGVLWHEDVSNLNSDQLRNRIRAQVCQPLKAMAPDIGRRVHRTTDLLSGAEGVVDARAAELLTAWDRERGIELRVLDSEADVVIGAALRRLAQLNGLGLDKVSYGLIADAIDAIRKRRNVVQQWSGSLVLQVTSERVNLGHQDLRSEPGLMTVVNSSHSKAGVID